MSYQGIVSGSQPALPSDFTPSRERSAKPPSRGAVWGRGNRVGPKTKEKYLKRCRVRVEAAQKFRQQEGLDELWDRLRDLYRTKHFPKGIGQEDRIAIAMAFSTINVIGPSIAVNHPKITVSAKHPDAEDSAVIVEAIVNYWWKHYDIHSEWRRVVKDYLIFGFGWLKTGYRFVEEEVDKDEDEIADELTEEFVQLDEFAAAQPELAGDLPTDEDVQDQIVSTKMVVVEDRPFAERVSIKDVYVDPDALHPNDMTWIAQRLLKTYEEVRENPHYKQSAVKKIKPSTEHDAGYWPEQHKNDPDCKRIVVWEFYDIKQRSMCVFAEQGDDFLVDPKDQPYSFGHPFTMLRNYEVPDYFYPMGELEAIEDLQQELNKTRSQMMNDRKRFARKYLYDARAFSPDAIGDLEGDRDGAFVRVNEDVPLGEAVIPLKQEQLDPSIYQQSEQIESDINTITGVSEYARGGGDQTIRRTATEASMIQDAANARAADKLAQVTGVVGVIARRLVMLAQEFLTEAQVARVTNAMGHPLWFEYEPDDIAGEFDFDVEGGSTRPVTEQERRDKAMALLQTLSPYGDPSIGLVNMEEVIRYVLTYGFEIRDPGRFMGPGPMMPPPGMEEPPPEGGAPPGMPSEPGIPDQGGAPPQPPGGIPAGPQGQIPPDILAQLENQVGVTLPTMQ